MKVTETVSRDSITFCVHCGARHEIHLFTDAAGSSDWEYRKVKEVFA